MSSSPAAAVMLCDVIGGGGHNGHLVISEGRVTRFETVDGALAAAEAIPCREGCQGVHLVVYRTGSGRHEPAYGTGNLVWHPDVAVAIVDRRARPSIAEELEALYPRSVPLPVESQPIDGELNGPLGARPVPVQGW